MKQKEYKTAGQKAGENIICNNPYLENHLETNRPPVNMLLNITPVKLSEMDIKHWNLQQTPLKTSLDQMEAQLRDMVHTVGPETAFSMAQIVERIKSLDKTDAVSAAGYGVAGLSGYAATGELTVNTINQLMRELHKEAIEKFGKKALHTANTKYLRQMEHFLNGHPKYVELMKNLKKLPKILLPKGGYTTVTAHTNYPNARFVHSHISVPLKKWTNPSQYVNRMAKQLNRRVKMFRRLGRWGTWYVPALLGVASVATAPPEERWRTVFKEGFGVLGGAFGTKVGLFAGLGIVTVLGLGPVGLFVAVFVCTTAGGIIGMKGGQWGGAFIILVRNYLGFYNEEYNRTFS
jgi:hypothetical protein